MATRGDSSFKSDLKRDGYSQEEKYFNELNRELIDQLRAKRKAANASKSPSEEEQSSEPPAPKSRLKRILKKIFGPTEVNPPDIF